MRFIDETRIRITSGNGGDGCASFRREKFVPFGGPDGGNGGRGGDVVLVATHQRSTLIELRGKAHWKAQNGGRGRGRERTGASGESIEIHLPVGTRVHDADTGDVIVDLTEDGQRFVAAQGGKGGLGNMVFKSSTNRAPRKSTPGKPGQERHLHLELMLMADVGLLGFPNADKSTMVSRVSSARPKVADYPFTTLVPSLGVVDMGVEGSFVVADVPGLIEGAAEGAGLGHRFLKHVSRTRVLLHLVSLGPDEERDPVARYQAIRHELAAFDPGLVERPEILVLTKRDLVDDEVVTETLAALAAGISPVTSREAHVISAVTGQGVPDLVRAMWTLLLGMELQGRDS